MALGEVTVDDDDIADGDGDDVEATAATVLVVERRRS